MNPGMMRERVTIQVAAAGARDAFGAAADTWVDVATVWAQIDRLSSREVLLAKQVESQASYKVTIRYYDDLTTAHRFNWGGTYLYIESILYDAPGNYQTVMCGERV